MSQISSDYIHSGYSLSNSI